MLLFVGVLCAPVFLAAQSQARSEPLLAPEATRVFHERHAGTSVWADDSDYDALVEAIQGLETHGLNPNHYHLARLAESREDRDQREMYATDAWFSAAAHMLYGKLDPVSVEPDWTAIRREADLGMQLEIALAEQSVAESLSQFAPVQKGYKTLLQEYRQIRDLASQPFTAVPLGPTLRRGMAGERVATLQQRLLELGLLGEGYSAGTMDALTDEAVRFFQLMNDLNDDGLVGPATLAALNLGQQEKLNKLRVNLERWRWLPDDLGRRHLRANIAGFNVTAWENGAPVRSHLTIVGKTYRKTPVFSDEIEYIIFNPWWEVPPSIARIDKLPLFREEPGLANELGFQVLDRDGMLLDNDLIDWHAIRPGSFPYRLRQAPGEQNALGQVKIMFPNTHNVYLHDTPTRGLFEQRQRAFSSGCLRTQFPIDLSQWLLEETSGWDRSRIDQSLASGQETRVNLAVRVPVHVLYFTAVSEEYGGVRYLDDIYQRDDAVLWGLRETPF